MAKYKQQKDGLYKTSISTGKFDANGKPIRLYLSAKSCRALEAKVIDAKAKLASGTYADDKGNTFGTYAEHWYHTYPEKLTEHATHMKYKGIIKNHIGPIRDMKLSDITKSDIQNLINDAAGHPDTQRMIKLTVNQILESAIDDGLLYHNVCKKIKVSVEKNPASRRALTAAEKSAISSLKSEGAFTDMEQLFIDTLYVSGLRTEEALALTYMDVKDCKIDVNKALSWKGGKHIKSPKSKAGYRQIDVPEWYQKEVDKYREQNPDILCLFHGKDSQEYLSNASYKTFWNGIYNKINGKLGGTPKVYRYRRVVTQGIAATDLTPYIFRHNYCTMLYDLKIDIKEAARIMGHSNIRLTLEIYTHLESIKSTTQDKVAQIAL